MLYFRTRRKGGDFPSSFPSDLKTEVFLPENLLASVAQLVNASVFSAFSQVKQRWARLELGWETPETMIWL